MDRWQTTLAAVGARRRAQGRVVNAGAMHAQAITAADAGLASCTVCGLLARRADQAEASFGHCPRCGAHLESRRSHSVQRTWALIITAALLYIPANALPVLITTTIGSTQADTIMSGVVFLYTSGSWVLALIVLIASVMIPIGKLLALAYLLVSVQRGEVDNRSARTRLHRVVNFIGRWSMLDVFVDTFVVALVQLQPLMQAQPGPGVPMFMGVVILTMLASKSFDARLIWDDAQKSRGRRG